MKEKIIAILKQATNLPEEEIKNLIEIPPSPELGDYSFPCFSLAKLYKKNPNEIANELAQKISPTKEISKISPVASYLNFFINPEELAESTIKKILKEKDSHGKQKIKEKVIIESPGPNTNKPLHIGHARNIILAQSLQNLLQFMGNNVKIVDIINDRGVHICKSMLAYEKFGNNLTPKKAGEKSDHFVGGFYVKFSQELQKNPELEKEVQECLRKWESGDEKTIRLWKKMNSWALTGIKETYKKFNLKIDKSYFESKTYKLGKQLVLEQFKKGKVKRKQDGALFADLTQQGLGEKILIRTDGTSIYITQDLYLAILRKKEYNFDKMFYIVANEQDYHFKALFAILKLFNYNWVNELFHFSYGLVHLESGRLKSREGKIVDADNLIDELEDLALKEIESRHPKLTKKEKSFRAFTIAMSALRYYFLKIDRTKDIVFKPKEAINFEGNTGPYLLYTYARAKSILRKAGYNPKKQFRIMSISQQEKLLISQLSKFPETVLHSYKNLAPNIIANYTYELAQTFNEFYHKEKVIGSENEQFKLSLVNAFSQILKNTLSILAINTTEKM